MHFTKGPLEEKQSHNIIIIWSSTAGSRNEVLYAEKVNLRFTLAKLMIPVAFGKLDVSFVIIAYKTVYSGISSKQPVGMYILSKGWYGLFWA